MNDGVELKPRNSGQFQKGNPGGPGNPHARQVALIRSALLAALTPEVIEKIMARLVEHAVEGNMAAIKLLLAYSIGRPGKAEDALAQLAEGGPEAAFFAAPNAASPHSAPEPASPAAEECGGQGSAAAPPGRHQTPFFAPAPDRPQGETSRRAVRRQTPASQAARILQAALADGGRQQSAVDALDREFELLGLIKDVLDPSGPRAPAAEAREIALVS
jgi:hypothetical protein